MGPPGGRVGLSSNILGVQFPPDPHNLIHSFNIDKQNRGANI